MKRVLLFLLVAVMSISLIACTTKTTTQEATPEATPVEETKQTEQITESTFDIVGEQPVMVTSFGQSADVAMLKALFSKVGVEINYNTVATADDLGDTKTLFIAAGASTKGMGAAGIKPEEELERARLVIDKAKELNIKIVAVHLGGAARRGESSDEFIKLAVDNASGIIVVAEGNEDGMFTKVAEENSISLAVIESIASAVEPLKMMFK